MHDSSAVIDALFDCGWWVGSNALHAAMINELIKEAHILQADGRMSLAGVGRGRSHQVHNQTRSDSIFWLDGSSEAQREYLKTMEDLRLQLNRELMLGLFEYESHFAHYRTAASYSKHRDSFSGAASRVVSVVTYLNADWLSENGGELLLYDEAAENVLERVLPEAGTVVIFLSEKIPHEVLPANCDRYSIAGWFRVNASSGNRIDVMG